MSGLFASPDAERLVLVFRTTYPELARRYGTMSHLTLASLLENAGGASRDEAVRALLGARPNVTHEKVWLNLDKKELFADVYQAHPVEIRVGDRQITVFHCPNDGVMYVDTFSAR